MTERHSESAQRMIVKSRYFPSGRCNVDRGLWSRATQAIIACSLLAVVAGCTPARMALSPQLAAGEMPVAGRQGWGVEPMLFGPYRAVDIHRGWRTTTAWGFLGYRSAQADQSYWFSLQRDGRPRFDAQCATGVQARDLDLQNFLGSDGTLGVELETAVLFACTFDGADGVNWRLVMNQGTGEGAMNGFLSGGGHRIDVRGNQALEGGAWELSEATGYQLEQRGRPIGAVEVINDGAVWLTASASADLRAGMAAAAAALLLYRDVRS